MIHKLDVNYTLTVPGNDPYYYTASVLASTPICESTSLLRVLSCSCIWLIVQYFAAPPVFEAVCTESGISFKLDHRPSDYLWEISIGSDLLTSELAAMRGYVISNSSQSLLLDVPLFTPGYEYRVRVGPSLVAAEVLFKLTVFPAGCYIDGIPGHI